MAYGGKNFVWRLVICGGKLLRGLGLGIFAFCVIGFCRRNALGSVRLFSTPAVTFSQVDSVNEPEAS